MTKHTFTNLEAAYKFYAECGMSGKAATMQTDIPCKQWTVVVYA